MLNIQVFPVFLRGKSALRISVICNQFEYKSHLYFLKLPMEIGSKSKSRHKFNFSSLMGQIFHSGSKCSKCPQISLSVVVLSLCFCPTTCPLFLSQSFQGWIKGSPSSQIFSHFPERTGFLCWLLWGTPYCGPGHRPGTGLLRLLSLVEMGGMMKESCLCFFFLSKKSIWFLEVWKQPNFPLCLQGNEKNWIG